MSPRPAVLAATVLAACTAAPPPAPPALALTETTFAALPGWQADPAGETRAAFAAQCARLARLPADTALGGTDLARAIAGHPADWKEPCAALPPTPDDAAMRRFVEARFQPYRIDAPAMLTGYFEPLLRGARTPDATYRIPVLARPADLVTEAAPDPAAPPRIGRRAGTALIPYFSRAEIEAGRSPARPLLYLADPADLYVLQLQGAGRVLLPDGATVHLAFAGSNGRPSTPIGRVLAERRAMPEPDITVATIRAWLAAHTDQAQAVLESDEHYTFFRLADSGPAGTLGVPLTPGRSAAIDRHALPLGAPLFLVTRDPVSGFAWRHLVLAQDTGTDLHGPARAGIFLGAGAAAARMAGAMRESGTEYLLLPRPAATAQQAGLKSELAQIAP